MIYWLAKNTVYLLFKIFFALEIVGSENIPPEGGFIIASNHVSYIDPMAVGVTCPRKINFMAKDELFKNRIFGWLLKKLNTFPLKRYSSDSRALREAIRKLKEGRGVSVFPEGTRSDSDSLREGNIGVSVLSFVANAPVVPCYVKGSYKIWPSNGHFFHKGKLKVFFGEPLPPPVVRENAKKTDYYEFAQKVMLRITALKDKA